MTKVFSCKNIVTNTVKRFAVYDALRSLHEIPAVIDITIFIKI